MSQNGKFIIGGRQVENTDGRKALELFSGIRDPALQQMGRIIFLIHSIPPRLSAIPV
ncbi:MAG TPA: hypothetical protein PLG94_08585 [Smithellaceae bacterium]|jgi:hypothetical protein|nr:hypothetical protein [Smithellaceae bacterium]HOG81149.1 hypothetical protein [Smithellaceae bacterium]HOQ43063.1 hypothetical protein [Smithellaceae bacterium]HPL66577.1 hypothetical protein [Smithellaceae bacterium]HQP24853.1 hypothetical protein [Smithellaceae bacterium]